MPPIPIPSEVLGEPEPIRSKMTDHKVQRAHRVSDYLAGEGHNQAAEVMNHALGYWNLAGAPGNQTEPADFTPEEQKEASYNNNFRVKYPKTPEGYAKQSQEWRRIMGYGAKVLEGHHTSFSNGRRDIPVGHVALRRILPNVQQVTLHYPQGHFHHFFKEDQSGGEYTPPAEPTPSGESLKPEHSLSLSRSKKVAISYPIKFAKPPRLNVNEQGVPNKTGKISKPRGKKATSAPVYPPTEPEVPPIDPDEIQGNAPYAGTYEPIPEPQRPFHELEEETFPVEELGGGGAEGPLQLLDPNGQFGQHGPMHFAELYSHEMGGGTHSETPRAERAKQIIEAARQAHDSPMTVNGPNGVATIANTSRIHSGPVSNTSIPLGHMRISPLVPGHTHLAQVHYPLGMVTSYRARLNNHGTGYE